MDSKSPKQPATQLDTLAFAKAHLFWILTSVCLSLPVVGIFAHSISLVAISWLMARREGITPGEAFPVKKVTARNLVFPAVLALAIHSGQFLALFLLDVFLKGNLLPALEAMARDYIERLPSGVLSWVVLSGFVAPVSEELFYRGFGLLCFRDWGHGWAIVVPAVVFAMGHIPANWVGAFLVGLAAAVLTLKFSSIWPAVVIHAVGNLSSHVCGTLEYWLHGKLDGLPHWSLSAVVHLAGLFPLLAFGNDLRDMWRRIAEAFRAVRRDELFGPRLKTLTLSWPYVLLLVYLLFSCIAAMVLALRGSSGA